MTGALFFMVAIPLIAISWHLHSISQSLKAIEKEVRK